MLFAVGLVRSGCRPLWHRLSICFRRLRLWRPRYVRHRPQLAMARAISQLNKDAASSCDGGGADSNGAGSGRRSTDSSHSTSSAAVVETDPAGASAGHTQAGALDTDAESDAAADEPADADGTTVTGEDTTYHRVCGPQQEFMEQHLQRARNGALASWPSFTVEPPNPMTMKAAGGAGGFCVRTTHFWAPHVFFRDQGIPQQPPCPVHGWEAVEARSIRSKGWSSVSKSRRVSGLGHDEFMLGTKHCCAMCKRAQDDAVRAAAAAAQTQEERESAVRAAKRQHSYCFMSYDPAVTRAYFARYPWGAMVMPAVICSSRTAITHELAHIIQRACVSGSNPTEIANKLAELKAQAFDRARLAYYSFQLWRRGRSQQTIEDTLQRAAGSGGPAQLTEEEYGLMSPSHALVRKWFMDMAASKQDYQFCWRQQHIGGDIIQVGLLLASHAAVPRTAVTRTGPRYASSTIRGTGCPISSSWPTQRSPVSSSTSARLSARRCSRCCLASVSACLSTCGLLA
eukprot:TRINITY_DN509_c0_g1_i5.p1 TRINITY_DN509_c0_g1~~TRINITY_DN509_c0_g1_i5.p1  ORF type:complete len:513 (+),score=89.95 TRINITY_DN509_c0_g1_i5:234-1772(+)